MLLRCAIVSIIVFILSVVGYIGWQTFEGQQIGHLREMIVRERWVDFLQGLDSARNLLIFLAVGIYILLKIEPARKRKRFLAYSDVIEAVATITNESNVFMNAA